MSPVIRKGVASESGAVAVLFRRTAAHAFDFFYPHTPQEDAAFYRRIFAECIVWVATDGEEIVGFCAARAGWIEQLYVAPERQRNGIGPALLARALRGRRRVRLWTFQRNVRARRLYASFGFTEVLRTDGARNEEKEPDVLLEWRVRTGRAP